MVVLIRAGPKISSAVKGKAVGAAAGLKESREFAFGAPFEDAVVGLVGEEDVALGIAGGAFGEGEIPGQLLEGLAGSDDFALGRQEPGRPEDSENNLGAAAHQNRL